MKNEEHPLLPSGKWEGFYVYGSDDRKHNMQLSLVFQKNKIQGSGHDDISHFSIAGAYNTNSLTCEFEKKYEGHRVNYEGEIDENGIWGTWVIKQQSGGFHIWPKQQEQEAAEEEEQEVALVKEEKPAPKKEKLLPPDRPERLSK